MNDTNSLANPKQSIQIADFGERELVNQNKLAFELNPHYDLMRREKNNLKQLKALAEWNKVVSFAPCAASDRMGWEGLQAVYYRESPASEVSLPPVSQHVLVLMIRPPEKFDLRYEGVKRDMRPPAGSIAVVPAYSSVLCRWQGSKDSLLIYLEPSLVDGLQSAPRAGRLCIAACLAGQWLEMSVSDDGQGVPSAEVEHCFFGARPRVHALRLLRRRLQALFGRSFRLEACSEVAQAVYMSPYHFTRLFKESTGQSPYQ
jgi:hypothetical protein